MTTWFTADSHIGHNSIIRLCNRPFSSVEEMNETMIERWNSVVKPQDEIFHLGDFAFRQPKGSLEAIFSRLNGTKHLIIGNHDYSETKALPWATQSYYHEFKLNHILYVLMHYPIESWNGKNRNSVHLHGHTHGGIPPNRQRLDVGADCWDYSPVALEQIHARLEISPEIEFTPPE